MNGAHIFAGAEQEHTDGSISCLQGIYTMGTPQKSRLWHIDPPGLLLTHNSESLQLFVANQNKPPGIISILVANRSKLLRLFADFKFDKGTAPLFLLFFLNPLAFSTSQNKLRSLIAPTSVYFLTEDEQFEADKAQVVREISALEPQDRT